MLSKMKHISNAYERMIQELTNLVYFCIIGTQIHISNMVICVHININRSNGLLLVKVLDKDALNGIFS